MRRSPGETRAAFSAGLGFIYLQKYIADRLKVGYGSYTHNAFSMHMYDKDFKFTKDVAYGTLETTNERLDVAKLIENKDELIDWIDNKFSSKEDFVIKLRKMNIIYTI